MKTNMRSAWAHAGLVAALSTGLVATAAAQEFSFPSKKFIATPGATVEIPVVLSDVAVPVAGVNYTLRISSADNADIMMDVASSFAGSFTGFSYASNSLARSGVSTGVIQGNVVEHRGVLYPSTATPATFDVPAGGTQVATILVPVSSMATGAYRVELVSDIDNGTGLLGVSDASGNSLVPSGLTRPRGDMASIVVINGYDPIDIDFAEFGNFPGWEFAVLGGGAGNSNGTVVPGEGLKITNNAAGTAATWRWDPNAPAPWRSPLPQTLYVADWEVGGDAGAAEGPATRLRVRNAGDFLNFETVLQSVAGGANVAPAAGGTTYRTITPVAPSASAPSLMYGLDPAIDYVIADGGAGAGTSIWLKMLEERFIQRPTGGVPVYDQQFSFANTAGWTSGARDLGGLSVRYVRDTRGLGIIPSGPPAGADYALGVWMSPADVGMVANSSHMFRVELDVIGKVNDPVNGTDLRVSIMSPNEEFSHNVTLFPAASADDQTLPRPNLEVTTYEAWVTTPAALNGTQLSLAFYGFQSTVPNAAVDPDPSVHLKGVRITRYNAPSLVTQGGVQSQSFDRVTDRDAAVDEFTARERQSR